MSNPAESELAHLHVWELLPWIVNGRASDAERKLGVCANGDALARAGNT